MNTVTKFLFAPAIAFAVALPVATPALADEGSDDIVVRSQSEMERWQADTTRSLNRALTRNPLERTATPSSGIVQVLFTLGDDGRASDIEVHNSSADWVAERSAVFAVRRLSNLDEVPVTNSDNVQFLANIIFAEDRSEYVELAEALKKSERARLASDTAESDYIALGG